MLGCSSQCCASSPEHTRRPSLRGGARNGECRHRIWRSISCFTRLLPRTLLCLPHPVKMLHREPGTEVVSKGHSVISAH